MAVESIDFDSREEWRCQGMDTREFGDKFDATGEGALTEPVQERRGAETEPASGGGIALVMPP